MYNNLTNSTAQPQFVGEVAFFEDRLIRRKVSEVNAVLTFGKGLAKGTADQGVILPAATGFRFVGIALRTDTIEKRAGYSLDANNEMGWPALFGDVAVLRRGVVRVKVTSAVTAEAPVYCIHTASAGQTVGDFRADANTDKADIVPGAVFLTSTSGAGTALIAINLP